MFENINGNDGIEFDAINICLLLGWVPFVVAWGHYDTAFTEWLVQTYFLTFMVFVNYPRWYEKRNLKRAWLWRALALVTVTLHPAILAGMWYVDVATKTKWHEATTMLSIAAVAVIVELPILNKIVGYFRPADKLADATDAF